MSHLISQVLNSQGTSLILPSGEMDDDFPFHTYRCPLFGKLLVFPFSVSMARLVNVKFLILDLHESEVGPSNIYIYIYIYIYIFSPKSNLY